MKNILDFIYHMLGGAVIFALSFMPTYIGLWLTGETIPSKLLVITAGASGVLCAVMVGYFRELEQFHYNDGNRWQPWKMSAHKHLEANAWPIGTILLASNILMVIK